MSAAPWVALACLLASFFTTEHFLPWVSWHSEVPTFVAMVLAGAAGLAALRIRRDVLHVPWAAVPFIVFGAIATLQSWSGLLAFGGDAVMFGFYMALALACLSLGFNAGGADAHPAAREQALSRAACLVAYALLAGAVVSTAIALAQSMGVWESRWIAPVPQLRRPGANVAQPNQLATILGLGLASTAFLHVLRQVPGRGALALVLFLFLGLAVTESRTGILIVVVLLAWWQWKRPEVAPRASVWTGPLLLAAFALLFLAWPLIFGLAWPAHADQPSPLSTIRSSLRWTVWPQLLEASLMQPWFGWGVLQVPAAHNAVAHVGSLSEPYSYAHNLVLDLALWMGWPVAIASTVLALGWFWRRARSASTPVSWFCLAAVLAVATHAFLEYPHAYAYFLAPVLVLIGVLEATMGARTAWRLGLAPAAVALTACAGLLLWSAMEYLAIEEDFRVARFEALRVGATPAEHHIPEVVLLTQLGALHAIFRSLPRENMPPEEIEQLRRLALRYPWGPAQYRYALALALNGQQEEAVRQLRVLRNQRGEVLYDVLKSEIRYLAESRHPGLRTLALP